MRFLWSRVECESGRGRVECEVRTPFGLGANVTPGLGANVTPIHPISGNTHMYWLFGVYSEDHHPSYPVSNPGDPKVPDSWVIPCRSGCEL